eukprot:435605-Pyramimonas_sp.AAC.1
MRDGGSHITRPGRGLSLTDSSGTNVSSGRLNHSCTLVSHRVMTSSDAHRASGGKLGSTRDHEKSSAFLATSPV